MSAVRAVGDDPGLAEAMKTVMEFQITQPPESQIEKAIAHERKHAANADAIIAQQIAPYIDRQPEVEPHLSKWIEHIAQVAGLVDAGCRFAIDELTPQEWRGLEAWRAAERWAQAQFVGCPRCGVGIKREADCCLAPGCGWRREQKTGGG